MAFFVSDLHGAVPRYQKLFAAISRERPTAVFIGGDFLPMSWAAPALWAVRPRDFINDFLVEHFFSLRRVLGEAYPRVFVIMGNDDARFEEAAILDAATKGVWEYVHGRRAPFGVHSVYGYAFVPPTPFQLKDWERYDVSRYVDPHAVSPEEGFRTVPVLERESRYSTIRNDLELLTGGQDLSLAIFLFHAPPYQTKLDLSSQGTKMFDYVPLDPHQGSIAVRRFIEAGQPLLTLHGHIHESARLSCSWQDRIGRTRCFSAAHDGPELALVRFDLDDLDGATRELI